MALLCLFWFASRYPQLLKKAEHVGQHVASMAFGSELLRVDAAMPWWQRIVFSAVNWLDSMKSHDLVVAFLRRASQPWWVNRIEATTRAKLQAAASFRFAREPVRRV